MSDRWKYLLIVLGLMVIVVWMAVLSFPQKKLLIIACDVGQGDASIIIYGETQILVDGGPDDSVLECLSEHIPFWDRNIELIVLSHPQRDHYGGLIDVLKRYDVEAFVSSSLDSSSQGYGVLKNIVGGSGVRVINPTSGMVIRLGMIYLDILHPSKQYILSNTEGIEVNERANILGSYTTSLDPNEFSVVIILRLGEFEALFTGDIDPKLSNVIADQILSYGIKGVEYIKIPHHGSKNGVSSKLLDVVEPDMAIISVSAKNSYGHPHEEVLKMLSDRDIKILRTDEEGDIIIKSDGSNVWIVK
jgi:competence protein ComEC